MAHLAPRGQDGFGRQGELPSYGLNCCSLGHAVPFQHPEYNFNSVVSLIECLRPAPFPGRYPFAKDNPVLPYRQRPGSVSASFMELTNPREQGVPCPLVIEGVVHQGPH